MAEKDSIEIRGKDNRIEISNVEDIEVKGDDNIVRIEGEDRDIEIKGSKNIIEVREEGDIKREFKTSIGKSFNFLKQKKIINILIIVLFLIILITSVSIRTQNLPLLKDSTSGKTIPLALDPFYFLRIAETMISEGGLPAYDAMRAPLLRTPWIGEILPNLVVGMYKVIKIFNPSITLADIHVLSPVIFFAIGLIVFFFMCYFITKSKWISLIASALLAFSPAYIYRTTAGFADHDSLGMVAIFACLLVYALGLRLNKFEKNWKQTILWGLLLSFMTVLTLVTWGGAVTFLLLVIPLSFLLYYLLNSKDKVKALVFYVIWILGNIIFPIFFGYPYNAMISRFLGSYGLLVPFVFAFMVIDCLLNYIGESKYFKKQFKEGYVLIITLVLGFIGLISLGKNPISMIGEIWFKLMNPFASLTGRLSLTVAENAQPFLVDWIGQVGKGIFWLFFTGIILIGIDFSKKIEKKRYRIGFNFFWIVFVCSILFSRISSDSLLNGTNFISQLFYFVGLIGFGGYFIYLYTKTKFEAYPREILFLSIIIFVLIYGRSASRIFFLITPFVYLIIGNLIIRSFNYARESRDDLLKLIFWVIFVIALVISLIGFYGYYTTVNNTVKYTGPSANDQWQGAMAWVRNNTNPGNIFVHWWDYGYWIQTLGERPTVTDGGHAGGDAADHYIGRYVLTTPNPDSALAYMKTWNVSYLLIDQTDLGKYPAYSKIGGDLEWDRFSVIPVMIADTKQVYESANGTTRVYTGTSGVDEDIIYEEDNISVFLPGPTYDTFGNPSYKAFVIGSIIETKEENSQIGFTQPKAVYNYRGEQIILPIRYLYFNGQISDFGSGIDTVIRVISSFNGQTGDNFGAVIYLSPKVQKGLFARLYLMNDVFDDYPTLKLAHSEDDYVIKALRANKINVEDFVYYQGFRGPVKIWEVDYPEEIKEEKSFLTISNFSFADKDYLFY